MVNEKIESSLKRNNAIKVKETDRNDVYAFMKEKALPL